MALVMSGVGVSVGYFAIPHSCPDPMKTQFCRLARISIEQDRKDFESGDIKLQEGALERFYNGGRLYHGSQSLRYCVDELPKLDGLCWLYKDWDCLARTAREIEQALDRSHEK